MIKQGLTKRPRLAVDSLNSSSRFWVYESPEPLSSREYKLMPPNLAMFLPCSTSVSILADWLALLTMAGRLVLPFSPLPLRLRKLSMVFKHHCFQHDTITRNSQPLWPWETWVAHIERRSSYDATGGFHLRAWCVLILELAELICELLKTSAWERNLFCIKILSFMNKYYLILQHKSLNIKTKQRILNNLNISKKQKPKKKKPSSSWFFFLVFSWGRVASPSWLQSQDPPKLNNFLHDCMQVKKLLKYLLASCLFFESK